MLQVETSDSETKMSLDQQVWETQGSSETSSWLFLEQPLRYQIVTTILQRHVSVMVDTTCYFQFSHICIAMKKSMTRQNWKSTLNLPKFLIPCYWRAWWIVGIPVGLLLEISVEFVWSSSTIGGTNLENYTQCYFGSKLAMNAWIYYFDARTHWSRRQCNPNNYIL